MLVIVACWDNWLNSFPQQPKQMLFNEATLLARDGDCAQLFQLAERRQQVKIVMIASKTTQFR